jgi:hypothetical protein
MANAVPQVAPGVLTILDEGRRARRPRTTDRGERQRSFRETGSVPPGRCVECRRGGQRSGGNLSRPHPEGQGWNRGKRRTGLTLPAADVEAVGTFGEGPRVCCRAEAARRDPAALVFRVFTLTTVAARRQFATLVSRVWFTKERAALTRYGRAILAIVPIEDLKLLERRVTSKGGAGGRASRSPRRAKKR